LRHIRLAIAQANHESGRCAVRYCDAIQADGLYEKPVSQRIPNVQKPPFTPNF
jgi:hypothetical protein